MINFIEGLIEIIQDVWVFLVLIWAVIFGALVLLAHLNTSEIEPPSITVVKEQCLSAGVCVTVINLNGVLHVINSNAKLDSNTLERVGK